MTKKRSFLLDYALLAFAVCLFLAVTITGMAKVKRTKTFLKSDIEFTLPADFQTAISVTNSSKGVVVGYLTKDGRLKAIQYSGMDYQDRFTFKFKEKK